MSLFDNDMRLPIHKLERRKSLKQYIKDSIAILFDSSAPLYGETMDYGI